MVKVHVCFKGETYEDMEFICVPQVEDRIIIDLLEEDDYYTEKYGSDCLHLDKIWLKVKEVVHFPQYAGAAIEGDEPIAFINCKLIRNGY
jgi:hypothetical protein